MIFNQFDPNQDIVAGRVSRVASGFWPNGGNSYSQSLMVDDFFSLTGSIGTPAYGTSYYDVRRTMYYVNMYPSIFEQQNNDPYFSIAYGNINGDQGSGSFLVESQSIQTSPTKAIYTQYKNVLLGTSDSKTAFTVQSGSSMTTANDIWVISFSSYKMKDQIDPGFLQLNFSGSSGSISLIDDSPYTSKNNTVYQIIQGTLSAPPSNPSYQGLGLFYPTAGIVVLNAAALAGLLGLDKASIYQGTGGPAIDGGWRYNPNCDSSALYTYNHETLAKSMQLSSQPINTRKSEYVPSCHYFIRVKNREFNYSNNPTYVYDGTDGIHPQGLIYNSDFITDPKTYVTTIGLYNDTNDLVAVAKLSRPAVKSFDQELLLKVRLDF